MRRVVAILITLGVGCAMDREPTPVISVSVDHSEDLQKRVDDLTRLVEEAREAPDRVTATPDAGEAQAGAQAPEPLETSDPEPKAGPVPEPTDAAPPEPDPEPDPTLVESDPCADAPAADFVVDPTGECSDHVVIAGLVGTVSVAIRYVGVGPEPERYCGEGVSLYAAAALDAEPGACLRMRDPGAPELFCPGPARECVETILESSRLEVIVPTGAVGWLLLEHSPRRTGEPCPTEC